MRRFMVLGSRDYRADYVECEGTPRIIRRYELAPNERMTWGYVDPDRNNIVAVAITDGSGTYPTRWNRIETGEHLHPYGPRGGLNGVCGVVIRD